MSSRVKIINKVVNGGPALPVPGDISFGNYIINKLSELATDEKKVGLIDGETGREITVKQILQEVVNVATGLRKLGLKRGDVVALCSENRYEYIVCALAIICCGATVTTASLQYSKDEIAHVFKISRPVLLICSEQALKVQMKNFKHVPSIKNIIQFDGTPVERGVIPYSSIFYHTDVREFEPTEVQGWSDIVMILYSSGTTGLPKGVMTTHLNALYIAMSFAPSVGNKHEEDQVHLTVVPWYHAYGLNSTIDYLINGRTLVYYTAFHPEKYLSAIQKYKVDHISLVPPLVVFLGKSPMVEKYDLSSVKGALCGAAPISAETISDALKRMPNCTGIHQAYGMTETTLLCTKDFGDDHLKSKIGSGGIPLRGVQMKVVDIDSKKKLGPYENGEICVKGPVVMKGYAGNHSATRDMFDEEGYIKTGDIGHYDEEGYFFIVDRLKELIKYKGNQVPPAMVENVLLKHPSVAQCGVTGAPDEAAGELPTAFVTLKPGASATEQELLDFTNSQLSPSNRLHGGIVFVNEIPKSPSGKILRRVLKQQLQKIKKSKL